MKKERWIALAYGLICHATFALGVGAMAWALYFGLNGGALRLDGGAALAMNLLLIAQFPLGHSFFLSTRGRQLLGRLAPQRLRATLGTTLFATLASVQVGVVFWLWSPMGDVLWQASGWALGLSQGLYAASWLGLGRAMWDAGLALQTGSLGWWAVFRGERPTYPGMPTQGLFKACRQPIYLAFAQVMWTGPVMTTDKLALAIVWTAYCALGPLLKESRFRQRYGAAFEAYRARVPYFLPRLTFRSRSQWEIFVLNDGPRRHEG